MKRYEDHDWQASMKLRVDYNNMLCSHVGQYGIDPSALQAREAQYAAAARAMQEKRDTGMKWRNLPHNQGQIVKDLLDAAAYVRENFDTFVVLGIAAAP